MDDFIKYNKQRNPFNHNYIFTVEDLKREKLGWREKLRLIFKTMYVQIGADGHVYKFKIGNDGSYYFFGSESI